MKIIKTNDGRYIKVDGEIEDESDWFKWIKCWGYRWNRNEQRWGTQCIQYLFKSYEWVEESALPGRGNVVD